MVVVVVVVVRNCRDAVSFWDWIVYVGQVALVGSMASAEVREMQMDVGIDRGKFKRYNVTPSAGVFDILRSFR